MPSDLAKPAALCTLAAMALVLHSHAMAAPGGPEALAAYRAQRQEAAQRRRRVIFNNDGDDHLLRGPASVDGFLAARTTPLLGSHVDTVFYCTSRPFGMFTHNTKVGDVLTTKTAFRSKRNNVVSDFIDQGTDLLRVMIDCCHRHDVEVFWSMRMNDTHDAGHTRSRPHYYFSTFKKEHPECLLGTSKTRPKHGSWCAVDFAQPAVREFLLRVFREICSDYDVDGIEMDFFRHLVFFRTVADGGRATLAELDMMTELVRGIRAITEEAGMRRGRPILMAMRAPDSVGYCKGMGLDMERWMAEGLVDVFIAAGDFRLNPWEDSTALGRKHGVPVYCDLDPSIPYGVRTPFDRNSVETYRGRAINAWWAGAAGIYVFNCFNPRHPLWRELGDPDALRTKDRFYFANVTGRSGYLKADRVLAGGRQYETVPSLHPFSPMQIAPGNTLVVPLRVGEDLAAAARGKPVPSVACHLMTGVATVPHLKLNNVALTMSEKKGNWFSYPVRPELVKRGVNTVEMSIAPRDPDKQWDVEYKCDTAPSAPWKPGRRSSGTTASIQDGALLIADRSIERGSYFYYGYPWNAPRSRPAVFEARARVVSGRSTIIPCDGVSEEEVRLYPDRVSLAHAGLSYELDTTDAIHVYRVVVEGKSIEVYVDGKLVIDGAGKFTYPAHSGRNVVLFGASSSPTTGEALWQSVRFRAGGPSLYDLVLSVRCPKE